MRGRLPPASGERFPSDADGNGTTILLPHKIEEYYSLNAPIHAYSDNDITAITESTVLHILKGDEVYTKAERSSLNQIKRVNDYLYFNDYSRIYKLSVSDLSENPQFISLTGTYFDINEKYIVTIYESIIEIYKTDDLSAPYKTISHVQNKPVAINYDNLFYVSGTNSIVRRALDNEENFGIPYVYDHTTDMPLSFMIANENHLYFISENKIFRLPVNDTHALPVELLFEESDFDLGKITSLKGLSFKGDNLLITDYSGSVQEYAINGNNLQFTGYAIASGLSAYNRVGNSAKNIDRYGDLVAALDNKKLTVIDTVNCSDYDKDAFINLFVDYAPSHFALGNGTILYSKGNTIKLITDIKGEKITDIHTAFNTEPKNISYQSEKYYAVYTDNYDSFVVIIDEKTGEVDDTLQFTDSSTRITATTVCADVFKNVYVADTAKIYKCNAKDGSVKTYSYTEYFTNAKKLATDLAGNLFVLSSDGNIYRMTENGNSIEFILDFQTELGKIKTFGLDFDRKETYFLIEGREEVFYTTDLNNAALTDFTPTDEFILATTCKADLKVYTATNANVYSVTATDTEFVFNGLIGVAEEYPLIAVLENDSLTLYALASINGVVLINESELTEKPVVMNDEQKEVFIISSVSAYAIPVFDRPGSFALKGEGIVRLNKGDKVTVTKSFTLLGKTFYEAKLRSDVDCYIYAAFTTEFLSEDLKYDVYEIETVKATVLYADEELTEELFELADGSSVKVTERKNGVLKILATNSKGEETVGFISEKSVKVNPNATVRNVLIILAVAASVAGTLSYFLLRRKK